MTWGGGGNHKYFHMKNSMPQTEEIGNGRTQRFRTPSSKVYQLQQCGLSVARAVENTAGNHQGALLQMNPARGSPSPRQRAEMTMRKKSIFKYLVYQVCLARKSLYCLSRYICVHKSTSFNQMIKHPQHLSPRPEKSFVTSFQGPSLKTRRLSNLERLPVLSPSDGERCHSGEADTTEKSFDSL